LQHFENEVELVKVCKQKRDVPLQLVIGTMDTAFCVLTSLALWMELNFCCNPNALHSPYVFSFWTTMTFQQVGKRLKSVHRLCYPDGSSGDLLGSHSIWKFVATHKHHCGCNKDDKDICGWWMTKACVSDAYKGTELPCGKSEHC
jgi:hypothetical protein